MVENRAVISCQSRPGLALTVDERETTNCGQFGKPWLPREA